MKKPNTLNALIIEMAARPEGVSSKCISGMTAADLSTRCCGLVRDGRLFRGGSVKGHIRYFSTPEAARSYDAKSPNKVNNPKPIQSGILATRATWAKDAEVVFTDKTKVTICPAYKPRFEAISLFGVATATQTGRVTAPDLESEVSNG